MSISCPESAIQGRLITKEKRHELFGRVAGGSKTQKPEEYQRKMVVEGTGHMCPKSGCRINFRKYTMENICRPNIAHTGFDYSENFDGMQTIFGNNVYINFKCIAGQGGSQTWSLRDVYHFIEGQLNLLVHNNKNANANAYFANILDGDTSHKCMDKFNYIVSLPEYETVKNRVYVGDLCGYFDWIRDVFSANYMC